MNASEHTCQITISDDGKNPLGVAQYWKCGRPAKATIKARPGPGIRYVCQMHANANDRLAKKHDCIEHSLPLT